MKIIASLKPPVVQASAKMCFGWQVSYCWLSTMRKIYPGIIVFVIPCVLDCWKLILVNIWCDLFTFISLLIEITTVRMLCHILPSGRHHYANWWTINFRWVNFSHPFLIKIFPPNKSTYENDHQLEASSSPGCHEDVWVEIGLLFELQFSSFRELYFIIISYDHSCDAFS